MVTKQQNYDRWTLLWICQAVRHLSLNPAAVTQLHCTEICKKCDNPANRKDHLYWLGSSQGRPDGALGNLI